MVAALSMMDAFNLPATLVLPAVILLSYDLAAKSSVRTLAAVSQLADAPVPESAEDRKALKRKLIKRALAIVVLCGLMFSTEAYVILSENEQVLSAFFGVLAGTILTAAHVGLWTKIFGVQTVVRRLQTGAVSYRPHLPTKADKVKFGGIVVWSLLLSAFSLCSFGAECPMPSQVFHYLGTAALVVSFVSRGPAKTTSIRKLTIAFIAYEAIVIGFSVALAWAASTSETADDILSDSSAGSMDGLDMPTGMMAFFRLLVPSLYAAPVGHYLACLLRFDYSQAATTLDEGVAPLALQEVPARNNGCTGLTSVGLVVPTTLSAQPLPATRMTYYRMAMPIAAGSLFTLSPLLYYSLRYEVLPSASESEFAYFQGQVFGLLSMFLTVPLLAIAVAIRASVRGENKMLWTYSETWGKNVNPLKAVPAATAAAEQDVERDLISEKPLIIVEDVDAKEDTPLLTLEEAIKS